MNPSIKNRVGLYGLVAAISMLGSPFVLANRDNPSSSVGVGITAPLFMGGVLDEQMRLYSTQVQLIGVQAERLTQRVDLHLALGGAY